MKTLKEYLEDIFEPLYEMANLDYRHTGFTDNNLIMYVSTKQGSNGPRVKVFFKGQPSNSISFSIEKEPKMFDNKSNLRLSKRDISEIKYWISINHVILLKFWNSNSANVLIADLLDNIDKI